MLSSLCSAWIRWLDCLSSLPVRWLRPMACDRTREFGGLFPHQWSLILGTAIMYCIPHELWDNWYGDIIAILALLIYWWDCAAQNKAPWNPAHLGGGVWLFLLLCLTSCLWAWDGTGALRISNFYFNGFLLAYLSAASLRDPKAQESFFGFFWGVLILTAVYGIYLYYTQESNSVVYTYGEETGRLWSTLENCNNYGIFVALLLPLEIVWALRRSKKTMRYFLLGPLLFPAAAIILTYSRTAWISLLAALFLLLWYSKRRLLIPVAVIGAFSLFLLPQSVHLRLLSLLDFSDNGASGRFTLWRDCLMVWRENWLCGIGPGSGNLSHAFLSVVSDRSIVVPPHSNMLYMEIAISLGILGFGAFLSFFLGILFRLHRLRRPNGSEPSMLSALLASLFGAAVGAIPEHLWFYPRVFFFWCLLYGLALGETQRNMT